MNIDPELVTAITCHQDRSGMDPAWHQSNLKTALRQNFNARAENTNQLRAQGEGGLLDTNVLIT